MSGMIGKTERVILDAASELLSELEDGVHARVLEGEYSQTAVMHLGQLRAQLKAAREELLSALSWHDILHAAQLVPPAPVESGEQS